MYNITYEEDVDELCHICVILYFLSELFMNQESEYDKKNQYHIKLYKDSAI